MPNSPMKKWHQLIETKDQTLLDELLADDAVFHSPVVHSPQVGKSIVKLYLMGAEQVLNNETFKYVRKIESENDALLEFELEIDGIHMNGIDLIRWNDEGQIVDFKVMVRPLQAVNLIHKKMGEMLELLKKNS
ncbi:MAG: nuclear transport factor 2 family protein [Rhodospirillales bacterium]|nr:nuclear transport factor 2 family protein [Rhodospirillales bacterium]